jgi:hypothetical protein
MALSPASFPMDEVVGEFLNKDTSCYFDFKKNTTGVFPEYPYEVFVGPNAESTRLARISKTVAYVVVDEDECGNPVEEKWRIKLNWSRAHGD